MNFNAKMRFAIMTAFIAASAAALAQMGGGRLYNPAAETTLRGAISKVSTVTGRRGWNGVHLSMQSEGQTWDVHLGPHAYLTRSGFSFAAGDRIEVVGSKVRFNGADALIAREVTREGKVLSLRDKQGFPNWSRGRRVSQ